MLKRILILVIGTIILVSTLSCSDNQGGSLSKIADTKDQLYIQVSALGGLDYFYDHKMGLKIAGEEIGVRTEYVGPAD